jgi:RNA polymerase sigma factor (sigma-70 family)
MTVEKNCEACPGKNGLLGIFMDYRRALIEAAARITGCRGLAEDVVQDAYLKFSGQLGSISARQPIAYLFCIVKNLAIDRYRNRTLEQRYVCNEEEGLQVGCVRNSPEIIMQNRESLSAVVSALAELPKRTRRAFELHRLEGLTQKEIALTLGVSPTLVNFMIRDAHAHCRSALFD